MLVVGEKSSKLPPRGGAVVADCVATFGARLRKQVTEAVKPREEASYAQVSQIR